MVPLKLSHDTSESLKEKRGLTDCFLKKVEPIWITDSIINYNDDYWTKIVNKQSI
jgi:hypothetical protein